VLAVALGLLFPLAVGACAESGGRGGGNEGTQPRGAGTQDTIVIDEVGYDLGDPNAPIIVIEFSDFGCPYCARFALETFPAIHREYIETGKVFWKYIPFVLGIFPNGDLAALAAECAGEQGVDRFWRRHDELYKEQQAWKSTRTPDVFFSDLARRLGLDVGRFEGCFDERRGAERSRAANRLASYVGVRSTPTFIVNGFPVQGALPIDAFRMVLDELSPR
jgi:protein-disulfide isomerase